MYWSRMRESHPLGPEGFGFTDRRPYFKALILEIFGAVHRIRTCKRFRQLFSRQLPHRPDTLHIWRRRRDSNADSFKGWLP